MLETKGLSFNYNNSREFRYPDIRVSKNETLLILGNSGSGKTTLLHLMAGLLTPENGSVTISEDVLPVSKQNDRFRGKNIGIIYQQSYFVNSLNVLDNLLVASTMAGIVPDEDRAIYLLEKLGIQDKASSSFSSLSVGEQQRVSIARALMNKPSVVLADEPTASLDPDNCNIVADLLQQTCKEEGAALIIVTHDTRLENRATSIIRL